MRRLVVRWYERAGVRRRPNVAVHALRRTFATQAVESGATVVELQALLGHASLETSRRYLAVVGQGLEEAVAAHASRRLLRGPGTPGGDA
jgi:integrase/recombinase XerD